MSQFEIVNIHKLMQKDDIATSGTRYELNSIFFEVSSIYEILRFQRGTFHNQRDL